MRYTTYSKFVPGLAEAVNLQALLDQLNTVIVGKPAQVRDFVACLLAGGHLLIEDLPGMGKTTLAHTLARLLGLPARYVSGYLWQGGSETASASHAWAEAHVPEFGWVGFDPANNICPTEKYVRVAIGLDYGEAAPVRGIRRGVADEALTVAVDVQPAQAQQ